MRIPRHAARLFVFVVVLLGARPSLAQPLGTFRWQLAPFCNTLSVSAARDGATFTLHGWDDQCGGTAPRAPLVGSAVLNGDATIGLAFQIVTAPAGGSLDVSARISLATGNGTWRDSAGNEGPLVLNPPGPFPAAVRPRPDVHASPGADNTRIGHLAFTGTQASVGTIIPNLPTGSGNTAVGAGALEYFIRFGPTVNDGSRNTAVGAGALANNGGSNNVAIGARAGCAPYDFMLAPVSNNIYIGADVCEPDPPQSNTIRIGALQTRTYLAGVSGVTTMFPQAVPVMIAPDGQLGTVSSSRRTKQDIADLGDVSRAIFDLRPVQFRYKNPFADGSTPIQYGLVAEEVDEVLPELVARGLDGRIETVKYHVLPTLLLAEVQRLERERAEQSRRLEAQEAELAQLRELLLEMKQRRGSERKE